MQFAAVCRLMNPLGEHIDAAPLQFENAGGGSKNVAITSKLERALWARAQHYKHSFALSGDAVPSAPSFFIQCGLHAEGAA